MIEDFASLVASRRQWIEEVLQPWCAVACRRDLLLAEMEWQDLAGRPAPEMTLWLWAWGRFPALIEPGLTTLNETLLVNVQCRDGTVLTGYPDARLSEHGQLVLLDRAGQQQRPVLIDEILDVTRATEAQAGEVDPLL